jgi:hypothetical protein
MVDFRYHVVSIVAVFLALGIGIVFGTTAINRAILNDLDGNVKRLTAEKHALDNDKRLLTARVDDGQEFGEAVYRSLVANVLTGERVVVVAAPGASRSLRDDVVKQLGVAGATVVGRIRLSEALLDPARGAELDDLVVRELPGGLTLPGTDASAAQRAMAELAYVLTSDASASSPPAALTRVLAALRERDFLSVDGGTVLPATNVVVLLQGVVPSPSPSASPSPTGLPVGVQLAASLAAASPPASVVVAAPAGGSVAGTELEALRADSDVKDDVSTVDDVDTVFGRTALVLALDEGRRGGHGHYGNGVGAEAPVPTPAPSP